MREGRFASGKVLQATREEERKGNAEILAAREERKA